MAVKGVFFEAENKVCFGEVKSKPLGADQVAIQAQYTTISPGTELAWLQQLPNAKAAFPFYPGYSGCGIITAVGDEVKDLKVGDRVVAMLHHAAVTNRPADDCVKAPQSLDSRLASAYMLVSIALQGVRKPEIQIGESVAVLGLGPIGNLAGQIARAAGSTFVAGIDSQAWRCDIAKQSGFDDVATSIDAYKDRPFDVVIEATGAPEPIKLAFQLAAKYGRVVLLGSTRGNTNDVNFYSDVHKKGLTIIGAHTSTRSQSQNLGHFFTAAADNRIAVELMNSKRVNVAPILSETVPGDQGAKAYERLVARKEQLMTFALDWNNIR